ncbi:thermotolerance protein [Phlyctema vagabunda]|uniref:Thermotolerance protein n=1 Tax=Phlyctema vagabunda TaxID=108571 RepID=A0ABR4PYN1_9HELO
MALETNTLVNGQWQLTTLDVDSVLEHYNQQEKEATVNSVAVEKPPVYGLLTQTIIRSPQAHWILPVKLRSTNANDVAFIGEDFVQIRELHPDGHLCDIIRRENFGAQIHNAKVIGSINAYNNDPDRPNRSGGAEEGDLDMNGNAPPHGSHLRRWLNMPRPPCDHLPPQSLVLHLTSGDFIFMMLRQTANAGWEFVTTRRRVAKPMLASLRTRPVRQQDFDDSNSRSLPSIEGHSRINLSDLQAGMHLAIDPSSRYMAIGCSQDLFAIYEMHTRDSLKQQWKDHVSTQSELRHIKSERYIPMPGVIHKMEFLYPSADDEEHVILLLLVVRGGRTRMIVYEWQAGAELRGIRPHSRKGHQLEDSRRMPSLLIPLTIKSAFILVTEESMAICQDILEGNPTCIDFNTDIEQPSPLHSGLGNPLWVSWARPYRLPYHTATRDDIYIAREDGLVKFFEIDVEEFVNTDMRIGYFDCNIGPAFACLDYQKYVPPFKGGDLLIASGDACNGGTYLVLARDGPAFNENIPNWSPAIDFATTSPSQDRAASRLLFHKDIMPKRDRVFACSGTGVKGAITEFRHGLEASVGTIIPYDDPIMNAWIISPALGSPDNNEGSLFLLSLADRSALIRLSADASSVEAIDQDATHFDLQNRTIAAKLHGDFVIQVTEQSIIISRETPIHVFSGQALLGSTASIERAVIHDDVVVFMTRLAGDCGIHVLGPLSTIRQDAGHSTLESIGIRLLQTISAHTTCLNVCTIRGTLCALVASSYTDYVDLIFVPITGEGSHTLKIAYAAIDNSISFDAFISLAVAHGSPEDLTLLCGTRNGLVATINILITDTGIQVQKSRCDRFGAGPVNVTKDESSEAKELFFVSCDPGVYAINLGLNPVPHRLGYKARSRRTTEHVWLTDALNPAMLQPAVISVFRLPDIFGSTDSGNLLVVAGNELILARLSPQAKAVPRHLAIEGTPRRIIYSQELGVLVVAALVDRKSTLLFIDPDTGADLSQPVDKNNGPVKYVSGLGRTNDKLLGLLEWPFVKDGRTWKYLVLTTSSGRVLLISYEKVPSTFHHGAQEPRKVRYHTRFTFRHEEPINAVVGYPEGLIYCSGNNLYCETLDITEKRFKRVAEYRLSSEARSLFYENGNIYAMTTGHSLEILQLIHSHGDSAIVSTHCDQNQRTGLHHIEVGLDPQLSLVSDSDSSVTGLWATRKTKADTLDTLFEAELPHSVQRFRTGNCRPVWDPVWRVPTNPKWNNTSHPDAMSVFDDYNIIPNSKSNGEILGLSIDGSLSHHTIIGFRAWHFLRFIVNLALRSPVVCPFTHSIDVPLEPSIEPKIMMHIDGDILRRCLEQQWLEELLDSNPAEHGQEYGRNKHVISAYGRFVELLQELHGGTLDRDATPQDYVNQAYLDLEFYLRPVL